MFDSVLYSFLLFQDLKTQMTGLIGRDWGKTEHSEWFI